MYPEGKLVLIVRTADPIAKVTSAEASRLTLPAAAGVHGHPGRPTSTHPPQFPLPREWPSFETIDVDASGRLWMQDYVKRPQDPQVWAIFDSTGRLLGKMQMAGRTDTYAPTVVGFNGEGVLVRRLDDDGAVHISTYPVTPVRGGHE